ncbi:MAG: hypothetical protein KDA24_09800 [Deltaproteobacteria bacterium]|nr:hypothetical protein [Deltaproteobacteria bacterium]
MSSLDPMWDPEPEHTLRGGALVRVLGRLGKTVAPHLVSWAAGMHPQLRVSWGATEYHVRRDGIAAMRRGEPGFEDNPRSNYNERLRKRQERAARVAPDPAPEPAPAAETESETAPRVDLSEQALRTAVQAKMGREVAGDTEAISDPDALKSTLAQVRASLHALDDVKDWGIVETLDDELYKLHKAVEYTMRNHKASEAKSKLDDLFK